MNDDAAVKDAVRPIIQDAVVELAAGAMRAGMLNQHVVVEVLVAIADEQAIDQAFGTFAGQNGMHVVANQASTEQNGV